MLQDDFQDSDYSKEDDELIIKPPQTSSTFDPVFHHKDKKKKRHSKECKSSRKHHHHHHHHHRHNHKIGHLKLSNADSSKRNQNIEDKSFYYKDNKVKDQSKESNKDAADLDIIDVRSKKLIKDAMESDGNVVYQEITDVRHIRLVKDIRENRKYCYKEEKRNIHSFQQMEIEWKKRLTWVENQEIQDDILWTEKEKELQDKDSEKDINEHDKSLCMEHSGAQNNSVDHLQIDDEKCYSLISSEEESIDYEADKKSDEFIDEENEHVNDQGKNITMSDISSGDDNDASGSEKESVRVESECENEKTVLQKESLSAESAEKVNIVEDFKREYKNSELSEKVKITPISEEKCLPQKSANTIASTVPVYCPAIQGCRSIDGFHVLNRIEEGTYGVVYRARDKQTKEIVALKRLKMEREKEGFPITSLREINTLLKAQHPNIVTVREIVVGSHMDRIYIVMDYVEHDLKSLMKTMPRPFSIGEVKTLLMQLLCAVAHLHDNWILHRDLKTSNLLLSHQGILKVGDFGLAREYGSPLKSYTPVVVTLWYRAPELLLGAKKYSTPIDIWSVGCIFAELLTKNALFPGKSESDQLNRIFKDLGTPSEKIWPGYSELPLVKSLNITNFPYNNLKSRFSRNFSDIGFDLLNRFLTYNPARRISAEKAKNHEFFNEKPKPVPSNMFPTWPARSEQGHRETARSSPKAPIGGMHYSRR